MENYIMLDGRKFKIDEKNSMLLRAVIGEEKTEKKTSFARMYDEEYYFIRSDGCVEVETESNSFCDDEHHKVANYCADRELTCQRALHETLNRLLWRYREEWDKDSPWDGHHQHWYITKNNDEITVEFTIQDCVQGAIYFSLADNAVDAIEKIVKPFIEEHPDFVW